MSHAPRKRCWFHRWRSEVLSCYGGLPMKIEVCKRCGWGKKKDSFRLWRWNLHFLGWFFPPERVAELRRAAR